MPKQEGYLHAILNNRRCACDSIQKKKKESACKPGSVENSHSSGMHVAIHLMRPTREQRGPRYRSPIWSCSGWGLPCHWCYHQRGALLPHHFTLTGIPSNGNT